MIDEMDLRRWIAAYLADLVDLPEDEVVFDTPFKDLGVDSADAVIMGGSLEDHFGIEVEATLFLRNDTIGELIEDLKSEGLVRSGE